MKNFEISNKILSRIEEEARYGASQIGKAYVDMIDERGSKNIIWLVPGELKRTYSIQRNINNDVIGTNTAEPSYVNIGGRVLSKNSPFGNALAELSEGIGVIEIKAPAKTVIATIEARAEYQVVINSIKQDAYQGIIFTVSEDSLPFEDSLRDRIKELKELFDKKQQASINDDDLNELKAEIKALETQIFEKAQNARRYRRTAQSIRQNFMLDPTQNKIKRYKLFNGPLIINGGPGTGKTTLLIHKIQYMLDPAVEEDINLISKVNKEQWAFIRNQKTGWIFFSPTDLLKKYLEDAMISEGLLANSETVKTWHQFRNSLKSSLGLFNAETSSPFLAFNDKSALFNLKAENAKQLIEDFTSILLLEITKKIDKIKKLKITSLEWGAKGIDIRTSLSSINAETPISSIILAFNFLDEKYSDLRIEIDKKYIELSDGIASVIQRKLSDDEQAKFKNLLISTRDNNAINSLDLDGEDIKESFQDEETLEGKLMIDINRSIKRVVRNISLATIDKTTSNSNTEKAILEIIEKYIDSSKIEELAPLTLFVRYFKPLLRGADNVILSLIPRSYKTLRRTKFKDYNWLDTKTKETIVKIIESEPKNTRLHDEELDLIIWFILKYSRDFYINSPELFRTSKHAYLKTYSTVMKGIVAVDEASDFSITQLACMYNLTMPNLNTLILAGDMMQQMNLSGIGNWNDIQMLLPGVEMSELSVSYRQTKRLLDIAIALHESRYGYKPKFEASEPENAFDPAPLVFRSNILEDKITWIASRIIELYKIYDGIIPNIALFVKDNSSITKYADALNNCMILSDHQITVKGCLGEGEIGSSEFVRVFNINLIKGMEFESVFFIDVDCYDDESIQILDKLIYVGVSRATYYLALILEQTFPKILLPIQNLFVDGDWNKQTERDY